ncbi:MAG TPA: hypothetical protein VHZ76_03755 [Gammaproteobacteria bacterium]|nr:hypothetical protein [Gammaproteobacteria bacterium]
MKFPVLTFIFLVLIVHFVYRYGYRKMAPTVESGVLVMALSVFALFLLPVLTMSPFLKWVAGMTVFIIWFYLAFNLLQAFIQAEWSLHDRVNQVALGSWVVGTAMTALLLDQAEHTLHGFIVFLSIIAVILWIGYLKMIMRWFVVFIEQKAKLPVHGNLLLAAVSTQSIVLLIEELFDSALPIGIYQILIFWGLLCYALAVIFIAIYWLSRQRQCHVATWSNSYGLLHGAMAISALAMFNTQAFSSDLANIAWWWALIVFILFEGMEIFRAIVRVQSRGLRRGLFVYSTSQWTRIFTFGMLYAATLAYYGQQFSENHFILMIVNEGKYVLVVLLALEVILAWRRAAQAGMVVDADNLSH